MSNFKIEENSVFHVIQTHEFRKKMREHNEFVKKEIDGGIGDVPLTALIEKIGGMEVYEKLISTNKRPKDYVESLLWEDYNTTKTFYLVRDRFDLWVEKDIRKLVMTKKCLDLIETLKVDKNVRYDYLKTLPNRTDMIYIDKDVSVVYKKTDNRIVVVYCVNENSFNGNKDEITIKQYTIDIDLENRVHFYTDSFTDQHDKQRDESLYMRFVKLISFIELGETTFKIVPPKDKVGNFVKGTECKNLTKKEFIVVDTNWNEVSIRLDGFPVRSHLRLLKPNGTTRLDYKIVSVRSYLKNGYNRNHLNKCEGEVFEEYEEMEIV